MHSSLTWQRRILPNGLRLLLYPNPNGLTTQISVAIEYGSNDDVPEKAGLAHFLEHMIVGGSQSRIGLHNQVEALGGCSTFETSEEATFTAVNVFPQKIAKASQVLSGLLFNNNFEQEKLDLERKVILNELAEVEDLPGEVLSETLTRNLFKQHPVRFPILGLRKTVKQITLNDMQQAHTQRYSPKNMILILTGCFSDDDVNLVTENFTQYDPDEAVLRNKKCCETGKITRELLVEKSGMIQAYVGLGFRTAPVVHEDSPRLDLLNSVLGMGESSRLFRELREKRALTYDFSSTNTQGIDYGFFNINCAVEPDTITQTIDIVQGELEKLTQTPVDEAELEKSKNVVLGDIYRAMDSPGGLPRIMADMEIYFGIETSLQEYLQKIETLTSEQLLETACKYFAKENYASVILKPT
jgi:predicted Zn-dependent peptidase